MSSILNRQQVSKFHTKNEEKAEKISPKITLMLFNDSVKKVSKYSKVIYDHSD